MSFKVEHSAQVSKNIALLLEKVTNVVAQETNILIENIDLVQIDPTGLGFEFHPDYNEVVTDVNVFAEGNVVAILINEDYDMVDYEVIGYDGDDSSVGNPYGEEA